MKRVQVLVVGGGPAGAVAARHAAELGASVLLLERRRHTHGSAPCTGLIGLRTLSTLGASSACVLREIRRIEAHAPNGHRLALSAERAKAVVIDRSTLEEELLASARVAGADVSLGTEAVSAEGNRVTVRSTSGIQVVDADVVIAADGASSAVATWYHLLAPMRRFAAAQVVLTGPRKQTDKIDVFVGRDVAPGFFAWAVPAKANQLRVGVAIPEGSDPHSYLNRLVRRRFPRHRILTRVGGLIPVSPVEHTIGNGVLLVGDAAGHVKPLTGGGLYTGGACARIAGQTAARAALSGQTDRDALSTYPPACEEVVGAELRFGLAARQALETLSDAAIDAAFHALDHPDLLQFVARIGDIDNLNRLVHDLSSQRGLWKHLLSAVAVIDEHARREVRV